MSERVIHPDYWKDKDTKHFICLPVHKCPGCGRRLTVQTDHRFPYRGSTWCHDNKCSMYEMYYTVKLKILTVHDEKYDMADFD